MRPQIRMGETSPLLCAKPSGRDRISSFFGNFSLNEDSSLALGKETQRIVYTVFMLGFLANMLQVSCRPMQFLYLQYVGFASPDNITFYVWTEVIRSGVPIFGHLLIGAIAARIGVRYTLVGLSCFGFCGLLLIIQASALRMRIPFIIGYISLIIARSVRVVRTIILTERVPADMRTTTMAIHDMWGPIGAIFGPLLWILSQNMLFDIPVFGLFRINKFTTSYSLSALTLFAMGAISWKRLQNYSRPQSTSGSPATDTNVNITGPDFVHVYPGDGREIVVNTRRYQALIFLYFLLLMFIVNVSMGLIWMGFQPILVIHFHATGEQLGFFYEAVCFISVLPPIILAYISRFLKDREIILLGLVLKVAGILCFLPVFGGHLHIWQPIFGFVLMMKASTFFWTCSMSLASKLLGPMSNRIILGMLSAGSSIGPAIGQLFFAELTVELFGTYRYVLIGIPLLFAIMLVTWPFFWNKLDPERDFTRQLFREYEESCKNL